MIQLTYEHNLSQDYTVEVLKDAQKAQKNTHSSSGQRISAEQKAQLDLMHRERVAVRKEISNLKTELANVKKERDGLLGTKTVRFQQVS